MTEIVTLWRGEATLAEGPIWDAHRNVVWFVDIKKQHVHQLDPASGDVKTWRAPAQVGWVAPASNGALIAGLKTGLALMDIATGAFTHIADVEPDLPGNRLNDATIAADGAIWFGSMDDGHTEPTGRFYRWDGNNVTELGLQAAAITNGPALSPDQRTLYHVDTVGRTIYASSLGEDAAVLSTREFAIIAPEDGNPDGVSTDAHGNIWLGLWGGGRARLYAPDARILTEVRLPAANVTKVALGGPEMKTAYVTTARAGLSPAEIAARPEAGGVFAFEVDIPGLPPAQARAPA